MDVKRVSVNKNDTKKPSATKNSDNHTSETYVTEVKTPICSDTL